MESCPMPFMGDPQGSWGPYRGRDAASSDWRGRQRTKKTEVLSSQTSAAFWKYFPLGKGDSMIQFLYCKCLLPSRRNQNVSEGGASGSEERTRAPEGRALVLEGGSEKHVGFFPGFKPWWKFPSWILDFQVDEIKWNFELYIDDVVVWDLIGCMLYMG